MTRPANNASAVMHAREGEEVSRTESPSHRRLDHPPPDGPDDNTVEEVPASDAGHSAHAHTILNASTARKRMRNSVDLDSVSSATRPATPVPGPLLTAVAAALTGNTHAATSSLPAPISTGTTIAQTTAACHPHAFDSPVEKRARLRSTSSSLGSFTSSSSVASLSSPFAPSRTTTPTATPVSAATAPTAPTATAVAIVPSAIPALAVTVPPAAATTVAAGGLSESRRAESRRSRADLADKFHSLANLLECDASDRGDVLQAALDRMHRLQAQADALSAPLVHGFPSLATCQNLADVATTYLTLDGKFADANRAFVQMFNFPSGTSSSATNNKSATATAGTPLKDRATGATSHAHTSDVTDMPSLRRHTFLSLSSPYDVAKLSRLLTALLQNDVRTSFETRLSLVDFNGHALPTRCGCVVTALRKKGILKLLMVMYIPEFDVDTTAAAAAGAMPLPHTQHTGHGHGPQHTVPPYQPFGAGAVQQTPSPASYLQHARQLQNASRPYGFLPTAAPVPAPNPSGTQSPYATSGPAPPPSYASVYAPTHGHGHPPPPPPPTPVPNAYEYSAQPQAISYQPPHAHPHQHPHQHPHAHSQMHPQSSQLYNAPPAAYGPAYSMPSPMHHIPTPPTPPSFSAMPLSQMHAHPHQQHQSHPVSHQHVHSHPHQHQHVSLPPSPQQHLYPMMPPYPPPSSPPTNVSTVLSMTPTSSSVSVGATAGPSIDDLQQWIQQQQQVLMASQRALVMAASASASAAGVTGLVGPPPPPPVAPLMSHMSIGGGGAANIASGPIAVKLEELTPPPVLPRPLAGFDPSAHANGTHASPSNASSSSLSSTGLDDIAAVAAVTPAPSPMDAAPVATTATNPYRLPSRADLDC